MSRWPSRPAPSRRSARRLPPAARPDPPPGSRDGAAGGDLGARAVGVLAPVIPLLYASVQSQADLRSRARLHARGLPGTASPIPRSGRPRGNTLEFAPDHACASVALGAGFAVLCNRTDVLGRRRSSRSLIAPLLLPPLGVILGWNALYGPGGYAHEFITETLHIPFEPEHGARHGRARHRGRGAGRLPDLPGRAGRHSTPCFEDAARSVGASPLRVLGRVTVPMLRPALLNAGLLVFTPGDRVAWHPAAARLAARPRLRRQLPLQQWSSALTPDPPIVSAGATVLLAAACLLLLLRGGCSATQARFVSVGGSGATGSRGCSSGPSALGVRRRCSGSTSRPPRSPRSSPSRSPRSSSELTPLVAPWHLLTLGNWDAIGHGEIAHSIRNSVEIAVVGAVVTTAVVALATAVAHRSRFRLRR